MNALSSRLCGKNWLGIRGLPVLGHLQMPFDFEIRVQIVRVLHSVTRLPSSSSSSLSLLFRDPLVGLGLLLFGFLCLVSTVLYHVCKTCVYSSYASTALPSVFLCNPFCSACSDGTQMDSLCIYYSQNTFISSLVFN